MLEEIEMREDQEEEMEVVIYHAQVEDREEVNQEVADQVEVDQAEEDQEEDQEEHYKMTGPGSQVLASIDTEMVDSHLGHQFHNTRKLHRMSYYRRPLLHSMMN